MAAPQAAPKAAPRLPAALKTRKDFNSEDDYGKYVKEALGIGQGDELLPARPGRGARVCLCAAPQLTAPALFARDLLSGQSQRADAGCLHVPLPGPG